MVIGESERRDVALKASNDKLYDDIPSAQRHRLDILFVVGDVGDGKTLLRLAEGA